MDADTWDRDFARLAALSKNVEALDEFGALFERLLIAVVAMRLADVAGIGRGVYTARLATLQALGQEQREWARARWPREYAIAVKECDVVRQAEQGGTPPPSGSHRTGHA